MRSPQTKTGPLEILAPAGNAEMLRAAVFAGADAVYLGLDGFNARRSAGNFTPQALREAVCFCHARGVAVHVTLNTLVYERELAGLADAVRAVAEAGADAVIVDDLAAAALIRRIAPELHLHASTQMSIHTPRGAVLLGQLGYDRAILARELSLAEIRAITAVSPIPCEVFVHGAMCMSMSGQCMMSAFLGGRSGNRGACAGPCRLPFDATPGLRPGKPGTACHLSLKDMDLVPRLRDLMEAGVASVKIEGRLRTPEYAAAAVAACRAQRDGESYDETLLRDIFSRSGFSDAYLTGRPGGQMFGVRTEADAAATRAAAPRARELFRRELPRIAVDFTVHCEPDGVKLTACDRDGNRAIVYSKTAPVPAERDPSAAIERALRKTGGTPFAAGNVTLPPDCGFLPGSEWNEMRRQALETLLAKRSAPRPKAVHPLALPHYPAAAGVPELAARFADAGQLEQLSGPALDRLRLLVFPLEEADRVPEALRARTLLELPRALFGHTEQKTVDRLAAAGTLGFAGVVANNLAELGYPTALPVYGGLGLNITNPFAAEEYRTRLHLRGMLWQPETALTAMRSVPAGEDGSPMPTAALCYGHLPLMLTRACPLQNVRSCAGCSGEGRLRDRKGRDFPVRCSAPGFAGMRTVYNPVPLYMGDRLREMPVDLAVAAFTMESPARVAQVMDLLLEGRPFDAEFTRGLYYTNN